MRSVKVSLIVFFSLSLVLLTGCSLFVPIPTPTLIIPVTGATGTPAATEIPGSSTGTTTPAANEISGSSSGTSTPPATSAPTPLVTLTSIPCNWAGFIRDVTVPDGTHFNPGTSFIKIWRIRNLGTCAWNTAYSLVLVAGNPMGAQPVISLPAEVEPGQTVDLSVNMVAPSTPGSHVSYWLLQDPSGQDFGNGFDHYGQFWIKIVTNPPTPTPTRIPTVTPTQPPTPSAATITPTPRSTPSAATTTSTVNPTQTPQILLDFTQNFCGATWKNSTAAITCPSTGIDFSKGSILSTSYPVPGSGTLANEPALILVPDSAANGQITGTYPVYSVQSGDRLQVLTACVAGAPQCNVAFSLDYITSGSPESTLKSWSNGSNGSFTNIDIDLSSLAGQQVQFILLVKNTGSVGQHNETLWIEPHIVR